MVCAVKGFWRERIVAGGVVLLFFVVGCAGFFSSPGEGEGSSGSMLGVVESFVYGLGRSGATRLLRLWQSDGLIEVSGLGVVVSGEKELKDFFGYCQAVGSRVRMFAPVVKEETVFCRLEEENEWLGLLGVEQAVYEARFVVRGRRIAGLRLVPAAETRLALIGRGVEFYRWLQEEEPGRAAELLKDGKLKFTSRNGRMLVELIARWRGVN